MGASRRESAIEIDGDAPIIVFDEAIYGIRRGISDKLTTTKTSTVKGRFDREKDETPQVSNLGATRNTLSAAQEEYSFILLAVADG